MSSSDCTYRSSAEVEDEGEVRGGEEVVGNLGLGAFSNLGLYFSSYWIIDIRYCHVACRISYLSYRTRGSEEEQSQVTSSHSTKLKPTQSTKTRVLAPSSLSSATKTHH